jgi:micrococcal nuclease
MSSRTAARWILVFVALAVFGGGLRLLDEGGSGDEPSGSVASGRVVRVIDGDTVRVRFERGTETVRYIGVDTPESVKPGTPVQCFAKRAAAFNRNLVSGRAVRLRFGPERRDRYGRLLAYVYVDGSKRSVSATLVARGYGHVLTIPPNTEHAVLFNRLQRRAKRRGLGLWGTCPLTGGAVHL